MRFTTLDHEAAAAVAASTHIFISSSVAWGTREISWREGGREFCELIGQGASKESTSCVAGSFTSKKVVDFEGTSLPLIWCARTETGYKANLSYT